MKSRFLFLAVSIMLAATGFAVAEDVDPFFGNWAGVVKAKHGEEIPIAAQVVPMNRGRYRTAFVLGPADAPKSRIEIWGTLDNNAVTYDREVDLGADLGGSSTLRAKIEDGKFSGRFMGKGAPGGFAMARVETKPPTLGAKPPEGAVVLFDGTGLDAWTGAEVPWKLVEGGAMEVGKGSVRTIREFGDQKLHIEFRTPFMPHQSGQSRGNSGVYLLGRYEVQVLDSFGLEARDNECGGLYKKATPRVNACLPPTQWQTYDIVFRAPKFDASGQKTQNAVIAVEQNGVLIHDNAAIDGPTGGGVADNEAATGPLLLQDHHCPVQYRNIWALLLD